MSAEATRLSRATLDQVPPALRPRVDVEALRVGIVHLGLGAFHRAHQALYTEEAMAAGGETDWGVCGVSQRSAAAVDALRPQDGLYTVLERGPAGTRARVAGVVRELRFAGAEPDSVVARLAQPEIRVVTLTVTEKGYRHEPATGQLRRDDSEIAADAAGRPPTTVVGQLVRGLQRRRAGGASITVLCCDNLPANGRLLRGLIGDFCGLLGREGQSLLGWIEHAVTFPDTMVDRIVPPSTQQDRAEAARLTGLRDDAVVVAEPFTQWVVEDRFAAGRPRWELAGVQFTDEVEPYETAKLRLLNGSHSAIAYLGALAGFDTVDQAIAEPLLERYVRRLMAEDLAPTLWAPDGLELGGYQEQLLDRFRNPALRHGTLQIAMDGTQKLPMRLLAPISERLAAGEEPRLACLAVAAWMRFVWAREADTGVTLPLSDPLERQLARALRGVRQPAAVVRALLALRAVFAPELAEHDTFRRLVTGALAALAARGTRTAIAKTLDG